MYDDGSGNTFDLRERILRIVMFLVDSVVGSGIGSPSMFVLLGLGISHYRTHVEFMENRDRKSVV